MIDDPRFFRVLAAFGNFGTSLISGGLLPEATEIRRVVTRLVAREDPLAQATSLHISCTSTQEIPPMSDPVQDTMHGNENRRAFDVNPTNEEGQAVTLTDISWDGGRDVSNNPIVLVEAGLTPTGCTVRRIKGVLGDCTVAGTGKNPDGSLVTQTINLTVSALDASSLNIQASALPADQQGSEADPSAPAAGPAPVE